MRHLFIQYKIWILLFSFVLLFPVFALSQEKIENTFSEETGKTTILLKGITLPKNKDDFSIGALFEYNGKKLDKEPCCVILFFTSANKKNFQFKNNHKLTIWADKEKLDFGEITWREAGWATAFIISQIAYPEEMLVGMNREKFLKIAKASEVKVQVGKFKFKMTAEQLEGFRELVQRMNLNSTILS